MQDEVDVWRAAQRRVRELEQLATMAMDPAVAQREGIDPVQVQVDLQAARIEADRALQACLAEAGRARRIHRTLGLSSSGSSGSDRSVPS